MYSKAEIDDIRRELLVMASRFEAELPEILTKDKIELIKSLSRL